MTTRNSPGRATKLRPLVERRHSGGWSRIENAEQCEGLVDAASEQLLFTAVLRCVGDRLRSVLVGSGTRLLPDE
jgi:hypothetical protein